MGKMLAPGTNQGRGSTVTISHPVPHREGSCGDGLDGAVRIMNFPESEPFRQDFLVTQQWLGKLSAAAEVRQWSGGQSLLRLLEIVFIILWDIIFI